MEPLLMNRKIYINTSIPFFAIALIAIYIFMQSTGADFAHAEPVDSKLKEDKVAVISSVSQLSEQPTPSQYQVTAVLSAQNNAVISGAMDGVLKTLPFSSGARFKKGDLLAEYDCRFENAKYQEALAQQRIAKRQAGAYEHLKQKEVVSEIDFVSIMAELEKANSSLEQANAKLSLCKIEAPYDGRITEKLANSHEATRSGRVLMEIASLEFLQAELLIPSIWLRWLNVGTSLSINIHETGKSYDAHI